MSELNTTPEAREGNFISDHKKEIVVLVIVIVMLIFIFQNMESVKFTLMFVEMNVPLVILILLFFAIGAISVGVYAYFNKKELKRKIKSLETRLKKHETL